MAKKSLENNKCEHCKENLTSAANKHLKEISTAEFNLLEFDKEQILKTIREDTNLAGAAAIHSTLVATGASVDGDVSSCEDALDKIKEKLKESSESEAEEVKNKQSK